jgi:hypothetical protein
MKALWKRMETNGYSNNHMEEYGSVFHLTFSTSPSLAFRIALIFPSIKNYQIKKSSSLNCPKERVPLFSFL